MKHTFIKYLRASIDGLLHGVERILQIKGIKVINFTRLFITESIHVIHDNVRGDYPLIIECKDFLANFETRVLRHKLLGLLLTSNK